MSKTPPSPVLTAPIKRTLAVTLIAAPLCMPAFVSAQERGNSAQSTTSTEAQINARDYGECPVAAINAAYRAAAAQDGAETFALVAIEQDTLRQCIERSQLIAKLITANNQIAQQIGIASADAVLAASNQQLTPAPQNCAPVEAASSLAVPKPEALVSPAPAVPSAAVQSAAPQSCARGYEVVYTAGVGRQLTALIQRRDDQWHVTKGFELPGGVTVKAIKGADVIITENGEDHTLPAAATTSGEAATE